MMFLRKKKLKKLIKKSSIITLVSLLTFGLTFNCTMAQQDFSNSDKVVSISDSVSDSNSNSDPQKTYRIIVKLNNKTASQAEASISTNDLKIEKSSPKKMGDMFSKYKIDKMEPVYKGLVKWKKKTGKKEKDFIMKVQKELAEEDTYSISKDELITDNSDFSNTYVIESVLNNEKEYKNMLESLKKDARFEYVEQDSKLSTCMIPNDPYFGSSRSWGQTHDDLYGLKKTSCPAAWDITKGEGITVAVVDTGIDATHPDITSNLWKNTDEIAGNGIDDDNNGYIDDTCGWNFAYGNNNPTDDDGHGTHVAGTIAAAGNNGQGIIGVAPEANVMAVKALDSKGSGYISNLSQGILYAAANGAKVINCSFGGYGKSQTMSEAIDFAISMGAVVVASAGNNNKNAADFLPACYSNVITVAATDSQDVRADFSNWGSKIDVAAPGVDILSLYASGTPKSKMVGDRYTVMSGTSMSAPHVSGAAALILSKTPGLSPKQVKTALRYSSTDVMTPGFDYSSGYGRINVANALQENNTLEASISSPSYKINVIDGVTITGSASGNNFSGYTLEYARVSNAKDEPTQWNVFSQSSTSVSNGTLGVFDTTNLMDGTYIIRLSVKDNITPQNIRYDRIELEHNVNYLSSPEENVNPCYAKEIKAGTIIPIKGSSRGKNFKRYRLEWAEGLNPSQWNSTGFVLENGGTTPVTDGLLGSWDSSGCMGRAGYYQLRLLTDNDNFTDEARTIIYIEPDLASGKWPVKLETAIGYCTTVLPAYNGQGKDNLIGIKGNYDVVKFPSFVKYSYDGELQSSLGFTYTPSGQAAVGDIDEAPGEETVFVKDSDMVIMKSDNSYRTFPLISGYHFTNDPVVLQDLDLDGKLEIMVTGLDYDDKVRYLYAFESDGSLMSTKFPIVIQDAWSGRSTHFLAMDINGDGEKEIITQQNDVNKLSSLNLYKWDGTPMVWSKEQPRFTNGLIKKMIGADLDRDGQGELILYVGDNITGKSECLYVISSDGTTKPGWPRVLAGFTPVGEPYDFAVADMDRNGVDEIIYSEERTFNILKLDGTPLSDAWPSKKELYKFARFSIGDINNDGYPEILAIGRDYWSDKYKPYDGSAEITYMEYELRAIDRNDQTIKTWTLLGYGGDEVSYFGTDPVLGDFDRNGKLDIALYHDYHRTSNEGGLTVLNTDWNYIAKNMDWPVMYADSQNTMVHMAERPLPAVTSVAIDKTSASMIEGQTLQLNTTVRPIKDTNKGVTWSVSSQSADNVATVSQTGLITANNAGTAVIRATSDLDSSKYAEVTITVTTAGIMLAEGFENGGNIPAGWAVQNVTGTSGKWTFVETGATPNTDGPKAGNYMARCNTHDATKGDITRLYRTSGISIPNKNPDLKINLDFWMYHNFFNIMDSLQVQVSTDGGSTWANVGDVIYRHDDITGWKKHTINLDSFKGTSDLRIAFLTNAQNGGNVYIDEMSVNAFSSEVPVAGISLNKTTAAITAGQTEQLSATVAPENATNKNVTWSVSSQSASNVATVSSTGLVTANNAGTAVIRATSDADPNKYAECTVTVIPAVVPVTAVSLNKTALSITVGQTEQLSAAITPENATNKNVTWSISSQSASSVVTLSSTGLVTANSAGTAIIRATSEADPGKYAECTITVTTAGQKNEILLGEGFEGSAGATPEGWAVQDVNGTTGEWSFVTKGIGPNPGGPKAGAYMAKFNSYDAASGHSTRLYRTSGIKLGNNAACLDFWMYHDSFNVADNLQVQVSVDGGATWVNAGDVINRYDSVAGWKKHTVSLNSFKGAADLRIAFLATSQYGTNMYIDEVYVTSSSDEYPVTGISLNKTSESLTVGQTEQLSAAIAPENATNKNVTWSIYSQSASSVATVSSTGLVTANNPGTAVIRATSNADSAKYAECTVTVKAAVIPLTAVTLNKTTSTIKAGQTEQLSVTLTPENATNKTIIWSVYYQNVDGVAEVSPTGLVTAKKPGTAVVKAMSITDLSVCAKCTITVTSDSVTGISLNKTTASITAGQTEQLSATVIPENAANKTIIWSVYYQNMDGVAEVSPTGLVTAKKPGTAVVKAMSITDLSVCATCTITVTSDSAAVTGISLNKTTASITAGQTEQLSATIIPENATNKNIIWSVSSQSAGNVATVSSTGLVTANNAGTAVIRATSDADPSKYAECTITVAAVQPVNGILLSEGFEGTGGNVPTGWAVQDVTETRGEWSFVSSGTLPDPGGPKAGTGMAMFNSLDLDWGETTRLYRTSGVRLEADGTYTLEFWMYHDSDNIKEDRIQVQVSTDSGTTWVNTGDAINRYNSNAGWKKHTISLDSYKGNSDVRIAFLGIGKFGRNMYLDEISVTGLTVVQ